MISVIRTVVRMAIKAICGGMRMGGTGIGNSARRGDSMEIKVMGRVRFDVWRWRSFFKSWFFHIKRRAAMKVIISRELLIVVPWFISRLYHCLFRGQRSWIPPPAR